MAACAARDIARHGLVGTAGLELVIRRLLGFALTALELAFVVLVELRLCRLDRQLLRLEFEFRLTHGSIGPELRRRHSPEILRLDELLFDIVHEGRAFAEVEQNRLDAVSVPPAEITVFPRRRLAETLGLLDRPRKDGLFGILVLGLGRKDGGKLLRRVVTERVGRHCYLLFGALCVRAGLAPQTQLKNLARRYVKWHPV